MIMKRVLSTVLAILMMFGMMASFASCGEKTDLEYVMSKGKLVVGITDFAPMDYKEGDNWIGFDADMATAFAKSLGVEVEFVEIDWDNKVLELNNKSIDCVWNGMTLSDEVKAAMGCSDAYCNNAQVLVLPAKVAANYKTVDDIKSLNIAVEAGSSGAAVAEAAGLKITEVDTQSKALLEAKAGTCDGAVIDSLMAGAMVGEGTEFNTLSTCFQIGDDELYGVGFRIGSDLIAKLNEFFKASVANGTMKTCAEKYGVQEAVILK